MNGWPDSFDELYDLYDNDEPEIIRDNFMYCIQQYGNESSPRKLHISVTDLSKVPKGKNHYDSEFEIETIDLDNSVELVNNFHLKNGKTIAQMMCDANGWSYSVLPIYPKWYDSIFGEIENNENK